MTTFDYFYSYGAVAAVGIIPFIVLTVVHVRTVKRLRKTEARCRHYWDMCVSAGVIMAASLAEEHARARKGDGPVGPLR